MKIAILKERRAHETRVAASPESVKKFVGLGIQVAVESGAGADAAFTDAAYKEMGAEIAKDAASALKGAQMVLKVRGPDTDEIAALPKGCIVAAILDPYRMGADMKALADGGVTAFAMDFVPRITRAQSMDVLSSQANLAGYKAVLDAAAHFGRAFPLMMTAAGKVAPAQVMVMGAGVAGLQAIATAKRLGAIVSATDVRPAAKEQVESLGGKFVAVEDEEFKEAESAGGYAKEMSDAYKKKQAELIAETVKKMDVVVTTALIPGRPAPTLITTDMVKSMKPGSVIVDLAIDNGGNCEASEPGKVAVKHGVTIVAQHNLPGRLPTDTSTLYANNLFNFVALLYDKEKKDLAIDWDDEIVKGTLVTKDGKIVHPNLGKLDTSSNAAGTPAAGKAAKAPAKSPAKSAAKAPAKSPAKAPAKAPAARKSAAKPAAKKTETDSEKGGPDKDGPDKGGGSTKAAGAGGPASGETNGDRGGSQGGTANGAGEEKKNGG
jgi:NAD(P) transhydrogenase subunit alpha